MSTTSFNRACMSLALIWALVALPASALRKESLDDFAQYYMGGAIVLSGELEALYPVPHPGATKNAGFADASDMRPAYAALAREHGLGAQNRFVYPPPAALVFAALAWLDYRSALIVWVFLMSLCVWALGWTAAAIHARVFGAETRAGGVIALAVVGSPIAMHAVRSGNVSPLVAVALAGGALAIQRGRDLGAVAALLLAGLFKGTGALLLPLAWVRGRRRVLLGWGLTTLGALGLSLAWLGSGAYAEFFDEIAPTLMRSSRAHANQSAAGLLLRIRGGELLTPTETWFLRGACAATLGLLLALAYQRRRTIRSSAPHFYAAFAGLVAVVLVFSPLAWAHYSLYGCGVWGWLFWEARRSWWRASLVVLPIGSLLFPLGLFCDLPEPLLSHFLLGGVATYALACARLAQDAPVDRNAA